MAGKHRSADPGYAGWRDPVLKTEHQIDIKTIPGKPDQEWFFVYMCEAAVRSRQIFSFLSYLPHDIMSQNTDSKENDAE